MGIDGEKANEVFLYNGEECFFERICSSLKDFINDHLVPENELEDWD